MTAGRQFEARADAIGAIRSYVHDALLRHGAPDEAIDAAVLCTSELATNALLHGDGPIGVDIDLGRRARVVVHDRTHDTPVVQRPGPEDDGGRGLLLVSTFADDWGVELAPDGKVVWFELDLRERSSPTPVSGAERRRWGQVRAD